MTETDNYKIELARANVYGFFSRMFSNSPTDKVLKKLFTPETAAYIKQILPEDENWFLYEQLTSYYNNGELTTDDIQLDFESLMRVPGPSYVYPYESSYAEISNSKGNKRWGDQSHEIKSAVGKFYRIEELCADSKVIDFPDHIGAELEYMSHLSKMIIKAEKYNDTISIQKNRKKQIAFAKAHLLRWVYTFSDQIGEKALTPFYKWISGILTLFMKKEERRFNG